MTDAIKNEIGRGDVRVFSEILETLEASGVINVSAFAGVLEMPLRGDFVIAVNGHRRLEIHRPTGTAIPPFTAAVWHESNLAGMADLEGHNFMFDHEIEILFIQSLRKHRNKILGVKALQNNILPMGRGVK